MHQCRTCTSDADFVCLECRTWSCFSCLHLSRYIWNAPCTNGETHVFLALFSQQKGYRIMKATSAEQALKEGKKFALLLGKLFQKQETLVFEDVSDFAQYFAIDVMGYRDAEIANAWTRGFISVLMKTPTTSELADDYATGRMELEQFQRLLTRALQAPPARQDDEGGQNEG